MSTYGVRSALLAFAFVSVAGLPAVAQTKSAPKGQPAPKSQPAQPAAPAEPAQDQPVFVALEVNGLSIASNPNLEIEGMEIAVGKEKITYTYMIRNKGNADVRVAADFALPDLGPLTSESETYNVGAADNPIGLTLTADGSPITAKLEMRAPVLGIDRLADIKAAGLPLIPFSGETERAVINLAPDAVSRLVNLGIVAPPSADGNPPMADWTLTADYVWEQNFPAGKTTTIAASFKPITGAYEVDKESVSDLDDLQDEVCLSAQALRSFKIKLKGDMVAEVTDIMLSNNSPMRWGAKPATNVVVDKPTGDTIVAFCGTNVKSMSPTRVGGTVDDEEATSIRVLLVGPPK